MSVNLRIGDLAEASGVSRDTIRYYERVKLLPRPVRTQAGYRTYGDADVDRVRFIKQAQAFGLSLEEIRELMPSGKQGLEGCRQVRALLDRKLNELDAHLSQMQDFREKLASYLAKCDEALSRRDKDSCPVLFELSHSRIGPRSENNPSSKRSRR